MLVELAAEVDVESPDVEELLLEPVELPPVVCGSVVGEGVPNPDVSSWLALQAHARAKTGRSGLCRGRIVSSVAQAQRDLYPEGLPRGTELVRSPSPRGAELRRDGFFDAALGFFEPARLQPLLKIAAESDEGGVVQRVLRLLALGMIRIRTDRTEIREAMFGSL